MAASESTVLVIGVGNPYRADDSIGLLVAQRLRDEGLENVMILETSGEGASIIEAWKNETNVILIDAVLSGDVPGTIHRFDAATQPLPAKFFHCSTHAFGVAEAVELSRALGSLPSRLVVYGVEGRDFQAGTQLSPEVASATTPVVERVRREVESIGSCIPAG